MVLTLVIACAPKASPQAAAVATPVDVAVVESTLGDAPVREAPDAFASAIADVLKDRNFVPKALAADAWAEPFSSRRSAPARVGWLAERQGAGPVIALVNVEPSFFALIDGRYRWTVAVDVAIREVARPAHEVDDHFEVPVLLTWDHEREDAAVNAGISVIERRVASDVEEWLGAAAEE
jgi:hypothetical protein